MCSGLHAALTVFKEALSAGGNPLETLDALSHRNLEERKRLQQAGQLDKERQILSLREGGALERYRQSLAAEGLHGPEESLDAVRNWFGLEVEKRTAQAQEAGRQMNHAFRFLEEAFGQGQELVIFVTELTARADTSWFVEQFGCDAYFRHNQELLFDDAHRRIREKIKTAQAAETEQEETHA